MPTGTPFETEPLRIGMPVGTPFCLGIFVVAVGVPFDIDPLMPLEALPVLLLLEWLLPLL